MMRLPLQFPLWDAIVPELAEPAEPGGSLFLTLLRYLAALVIVGVIVVVIVKLIKRKKANQAVQQPDSAVSEADHTEPGSADRDSDS